MKLRHSVCFPEEKEVPDLLPDQQCRASWWSKEAGIEISDPDQCLWNNKTSENASSPHHTTTNSSPVNLIISTAEKFWVALIYAMVAAWAPKCRQQSAWDFMYPRQQLGWHRSVHQSHSQVPGWAPACRLKQQGSSLLRHLTGLTAAPDRAAHGQLTGSLSLEHPHPISPGLTCEGSTPLLPAGRHFLREVIQPRRGKWFIYNPRWEPVWCDKKWWEGNWVCLEASRPPEWAFSITLH